MRGPLRTTTIVLLLTMVATLIGACGDPVAPGGAGGSDDPAPATAPTAAATGERWLAVVEVAPLADDLSALTERLRDALGLALVVSPVDCFEGLPPELEAGYLAGAVGDSAEQVEALVAEAGEQVLFTASVTIVCKD